MKNLFNCIGNMYIKFFTIIKSSFSRNPVQTIWRIYFAKKLYINTLVHHNHWVRLKPDGIFVLYQPWLHIFFSETLNCLNNPILLINVYLMTLLNFSTCIESDPNFIGLVYVFIPVVRRITFSRSCSFSFCFT